MVLITWQILKKASPYQCGSKRCDLCLLEKVSIICADPDTLLNTLLNFCWPTLRNNCQG